MNKKNSSKAGTLVIVESPSKAKTIHKYLGDDYIISSSVGHIIDLPKSRLAIDIGNDFKPEYITIRGKAKILNDLKKQAASVSRVLLATDPDREGEAISWHLSNALAEKNSDIKRIEFNEITEHAVKEAVSHPRDINMDLVNAQQARRVLDRIVGYYISPILWKKVKKGLSAGRVQSVALKVICDREREIDNFIPEEYWTLDAELARKGKTFRAQLALFRNEKIKLRSKAEVDGILENLKGKSMTVKDVKVQERKRKPVAPYITSKLQQDAANRLGFTSQKTMIIAQQLYEGIDITGEGPTGLITYMRTDSTRVADSAIQAVRKYILDAFDNAYLPENVNYYSNKKGAQDAHEAIRPTDVFRTPDSLKGDLTRDQYKIYDLIWKRFVASQMTPEVSEVTTVNLEAGEYVFRANGSRVLFKGFIAVDKTDKSERSSLPHLAVGDEVQIQEFFPEQHFTTPPPRYNDASLVKFLEESGIGRPSTYAPTINTLVKRYYVTRSGKQLVPTILGKLVNDIMGKHFTSLVSIDFTANMEDRLDHIEDAKTDWKKMLHEFYDPFKETIDLAEHNIEEMKGILDVETDIVCEQCGRKMVKKLGKFGFFLACPGFPECRNSKPLPLGKCPRCENGDVVKRSSKKGRGGTFYACTSYPTCEFFTRDNPADKACPRCGRLLFKKIIKHKGEKLICLNESCNYQVELLDESQPANGNGQNTNGTEQQEA
ncbi:MAG TPA: type I DNA topoisomerase [Spirochaetota bacterium]|nr:type I DNA topoisomerase [Spirochaetota bacterium]HPV40807.1 type I DNA topoisomerase [Spirochaetota bacterium]